MARERPCRMLAKERDNVSFKIHKDVYRRLRTVPAWEGVTLSNSLSQGIALVVEPIPPR